ncbi:MAG: sulfotransferase domain-containing protein [Bacteroidales bacterium]|nr:sulfotransferase domain-containing protein [Bacteroidales bacterium]
MKTESARKKKIFIQANCQSHTIKNIFLTLERLEEKYDILPVKPVHLWKEEDKEEIFNKINEADIFLHQPISEVNFGIFASDNLAKYLKKDAQVVSFSNLYFTGYHPQAIYLKDNDGKKVDGPFDYHDKNIVEAYKNGKSVEDIKKIFLDEDFYSPKEIEKNLEQSLKDLEGREKFTTIKMSPIIRNRMKGKKLFHIFNHPSNEMIFILVNKILERLGDELLIYQEIQRFPNEMLGQIQFPVYKSVQKYYDLEIETKLVFLNKEYSIEKMIKMYYDFYKDIFIFNKTNENHTKNKLLNIINKKDEERMKKDDNRFIILAPPRTGSTMVRMMLNSVDNIICHGEVFAIHRVLGISTKVNTNYSVESLFQLRNENMKKFLAVMEFSDKNKCVGMKVLYNQLLKSAELIQYIKDNKIKIIHLWRNDLEARHYSELILNIKVRNKNVEGKKTIYHKSTASMIFKEAKELILWGNLYQDIFKENPILNISYEDFLIDEKTRINLLEFLSQDENLIENLQIPQKRFSFDNKDVDIILENKEEESSQFKLLVHKLPNKQF